MILELAVLDVIPEREAEFERAFATAQTIIAAQAGYIDHALQRCIENPHRYVLLVRWETLAAHTEGFRGGPDYARWKELLHHFYEPFPSVEHYTAVVP